MKYTRDELKKAVEFLVPHANTIPIGKAVQLAAVELFILGESETVPAEIIRQALKDLQSPGYLQFP